MHKNSSLISRRILTLSATLVVMLAFAASPGCSSSKPALEEGKLQQKLDAVVKAGVPGAAVYAKDGSQSYSLVSGSADLSPRQKLRSADGLRVGSITKSFTAAMVVQLVREGKLSLNQTVEQLIPKLVPKGDEITLKQLLNQTSGLFDYSQDSGFLSLYKKNPRLKMGPYELIGIANNHDLLFKPGSQWAYSNTNYVLLGLIIEKKTGHSYGQELQRRLIKPLHLSQTYFADQNKLRPPNSRGYLLPGNPYVKLKSGGHRDVTNISASWAWAAGAIESSAADVAKFYRALLSGRLTGKAQLKEMLRGVPVANADNRYGLGMVSLKTPCGVVWGHDGDFPGFASLALSTPDLKHQMVVLLNTNTLDAKINAAYRKLVEYSACPEKP